MGSVSIYKDGKEIYQKSIGFCDVENGINFEVDGIGAIDIKLEKKSLFVEIEPPKKINGDYNIIKKWNNFLFEATGKNTKERKKDFGKIK